MKCSFSSSISLVWGLAATAGKATALPRILSRGGVHVDVRLLCRLGLVVSRVLALLGHLWSLVLRLWMVLGMDLLNWSWVKLSLVLKVKNALLLARVDEL